MSEYRVMTADEVQTMARSEGTGSYHRDIATGLTELSSKYRWELLQVVVEPNRSPYFIFKQG